MWHGHLAHELLWFLRIGQGHSMRAGRPRHIPAKAASLVIMLLLAAGITSSQPSGVPSGQRGAPATGPAASRPTSASSPTTRPGSLCIATYNINYGNPDLKAVVETIRKLRADVVAIQELNGESQDFLARQLGNDFKFIYPHPTKLAGGFDILSRLELKDVHYLPSQGSFETQVGQLDFDGKKVQIVNVHLCPTLPKDAKNLKVVMDTFEQAEAVRTREIQFISKSIKPDMPTIVLGDFNSFSNMFAVEFMTGNKYIDSFASVTVVPDIHPTWHWPMPKNPNNEWKFRLDYILHTPDLETTRSRIIAAGPSDHYPVVSELRWTTKPATAPASGPASAPADGRP
jgi:endonuclease/exonuclease/phosphatase family metal-dependent hydrolase